MDAPDQYPELRRRMVDGEVNSFAGAGLSVGAGLPDWYALISELASRIGYEMPPRQWATGDALIDAAQAYANREGLHSLISHLKDRLDTTGLQPTAAHRALARLPISLVFTANFDDLLERAFRDVGKRVEVVVRDGSIPFMRRGPNTVNIVKLYGDLSQPDTIVLARQQYDSYFQQRPEMVNLLRVELARSDTLYLGWSGSDPYFKLVFGDLLSRFGDMMRPGYAAVFDVTADQQAELARRHVRLIKFPSGSDRTARLAEWLQGLAPASGAGQKVSIAVPPAPAAPSAAEAAWNRAAFRDLLNTAFNDEEIENLSWAHFPPVYDDFASGMSKSEKIRRLLDYCLRTDQVETLLAFVEDTNPAQYGRFAGRLRVRLPAVADPAAGDRAERPAQTLEAPTASRATGDRTARPAQGQEAAAAVPLEGLKSADFRDRAAAVAALAQLGERFADHLFPMLADLYPQVRVAAIATLERLRPDGAWRGRLKYECYVPAGEFIMGDDDGGRDEIPAHPVYLAAFYIGKYPVTNADYARFMADRSRAFNTPKGRGEHPVVSVSWDDARDYANWAGMRLLTEAEWEKAASWEPATGKKREYPWGNRFDKTKCNTRESGIGSTTPVGRFSPGGDSPCGAANMTGNVWEWCSSQYQPYTYQADDDWENSTEGVQHVLRGGSFSEPAWFARCAARLGYCSYTQVDDGGLRVGWAAPSSGL